MNNDKQITPMICPVCGEFYFSELTEEDIADGETPNSVQCRHCGWFYDLEQTNNPNLRNQANKMSLNEFRSDYYNRIKSNPNYDYSESIMPKPVPHACPVCGEHVFRDSDCFEVCPVCGWEDDGCYETGGANGLSLCEYADEFKKKRDADPLYRFDKQ